MGDGQEKLQVMFERLQSLQQRRRTRRLTIEFPFLRAASMCVAMSILHHIGLVV